MLATLWRTRLVTQGTHFWHRGFGALDLGSVCTILVTQKVIFEEKTTSTLNLSPVSTRGPNGWISNFNDRMMWQHIWQGPVAHWTRPVPPDTYHLVLEPQLDVAHMVQILSVEQLCSVIGCQNGVALFFIWFQNKAESSNSILCLVLE